MEHSYAYLMYRTVRLLRRDFLRLAHSVGLDVYPEQWFILQKLNQHGALSQNELGDRLIMDKPSLSRTMKTLVDRDWVRRKADIEDGRKWQITLTHKGEQVVAVLMKAVKRERSHMFSDLSESDFIVFQKIIASITEKAQRNLKQQG